MSLYSYNNVGRIDFNTKTGNSSSASKDDISLSRMTDSERQETIKEVFLLVYGQEPTTRDISYYRYSTLTKTQLILRLLKSDKHKHLVEKGSNYDEILNNKNALELKVKFLENQLDSVQQEFVTLKQLLDEKNRHIHQLREHINTISGVNSPSQRNSYSLSNSRNPLANDFNQGTQDSLDQVPTYVPIPNKNYYNKSDIFNNSNGSNNQSSISGNVVPSSQSIQKLHSNFDMQNNAENYKSSIQHRHTSDDNSNHNRSFLKRFIDYLLSKLI